MLFRLDAKAWKKIPANKLAGTRREGVCFFKVRLDSTRDLVICLRKNNEHLVAGDGSMLAISKLSISVPLVEPI